MMMMMVVVVVKSISSFFGRFVSRSNGVRKPFCARAFSSRGKSTHKKEGIFRRDKRRVKPDPTTKNVNKKKELYELLSRLFCPRSTSPVSLAYRRVLVRAPSLSLPF